MNLFNETALRFGFVDRLRVLFGKTVHVSTTITLDREAGVVRTEARAHVEKLLPRTGPLSQPMQSDPPAPAAAVPAPASGRPLVSAEWLAKNLMLVLTRQAANFWFGPLVQLLSRIEANDANYPVRNQLVTEAVALSGRMRMTAGFRFDEQAPQWPLAYICLPTGEVSWYIRDDRPVKLELNTLLGGVKAEKYARCRQLAEFAQLAMPLPPKPTPAAPTTTA